MLSAEDRYVLDRSIRREIMAVDDPNTQTVLFSLLALIHELAKDVERSKRP